MQRSEHAGKGRADPLQSDGDDALNVALLTRTIRSIKFWAYSRMIFKLNSITLTFTSWVEGCDCHGWLRPRVSRAADELRFSREAMALEETRKFLRLQSGEGDGVQYFPCPLAGLRATDLATGGLARYFESLCDDYTAELMTEAEELHLDEAEMEQVLSDFAHGKATCLTNFEIKAQCWTLPPWNFAALASPDEELARACSRAIVDKFDQSPQLPELHHRKAWAHLSKDGVGTRAEFDLFNSGTHNLSDLPRLRKLAWAARFWPGVERVLEGDHSLVHQGAIATSRAGGPYVSCILRMPEVERLFDHDDEYRKYLELYTSLQQPDMLAKRLGFWKHPLYRAAIFEKQRSRTKMMLCQSIMYSLDAQSQYEGMTAVSKKRQEHHKRRAKVQEEWRKQFLCKEAFNESAIEKAAMAEHMQVKLVPGRLYSMPSTAACLPSLETSLVAMGHRKAQRPFPLFLIFKNK